MNNIKEEKILTCDIFSKKTAKIKYTITFQPNCNERIIKELGNDPLTKQFIELLIKDILHANPDLDFYKGVFILNSNKKEINNSENKKIYPVYFYPGYSTSFMETEDGYYLNVTLKNKIFSVKNILEYLKQNNYKDKNNQSMIKKSLIGKSFKVDYAKRNYIIDDISFDRNPKNQLCTNYEGATVSL